MQDQKPTSYKQYDKTYFNGLCLGARSYKKAYIHYGKMARFATRGLPGNSHLLDIGCGFGGLSRPLRQYCKYVVGMDVSPDGALKAKLLSADSVHFIAGNGEYIPLKSETFDCVTVSHVFEHLTDDEAERMQKEIYRVLKVNGSLVIDQPFFGHHGILDFIIILLLSSSRERRWFYNGFKDLIRAKRNNPKVDFHHLEQVLAPNHRRVYNVFLLINELSKAGFGKFKFFRKRLFSILFFNSNNLFELYVKLYLNAPEFIRRLFLIDIGGLLKVSKIKRQ